MCTLASGPHRIAPKKEQTNSGIYLTAFYCIDARPLCVSIARINKHADSRAPPHIINAANKRPHTLIVSRRPRPFPAPLSLAPRRPPLARALAPHFVSVFFSFEMHNSHLLRKFRKIYFLLASKRARAPNTIHAPREEERAPNENENLAFRRRSRALARRAAGSELTQSS